MQLSRCRASLTCYLRLLLVTVCLVSFLYLIGCKPQVTPPTTTATPKTLSFGTDAFVNIAEQSGLGTFKHTDGSSGRKFFVEQMGSGIAVFDYDNDGWQDVYFCSGAALPGFKGKAMGNRLFRNKQDGTFEDVTEKAGVACNRYCIGVATGDFDNDGFWDFYVAAFGGNVLYRNNGDGTFTDVTAKAGVAVGKLSSSAAWFDYDNDGFLDLYVANYVKYKVEEDLFCSKFAGQKSYCGPNLYKPETHSLFRNNGNGTFTDVSNKAGISKRTGNGLGVVTIDYNDDGKMDIAVANDQSPNFLWHNNGDGTFSEVGEAMGIAYGEQGNAQAGMGIDSGDYNNDGKMDIVVTNFSEESNALYRQEAAGFRDVSFPVGIGARTLMYLGFGTSFFDYDRDGLLDLFFANGHVLDDIEKYSDSVTWKQANQLMRNRGDGTFEETSTASKVAEGKQVSRGAAFGDLFNRGRTDVLISVLREQPIILSNEYGKNNWVSFDLRAAWGNPFAIGAKITLKAGGKTQIRYVKTCGSYASASDVRPLFGLGEAAKIDEVQIRWANGQTSTHSDVTINTIVKISQPPVGN